MHRFPIPPARASSRRPRPATWALAVFAMAAMAATAQGLFGCARKRPAPPPAHSVPAPVGESSFTFVPDRSTPTSAKLRAGEEVVAPQAEGELRPPVYPPRPLAGRFGAAMVAVRIIVGTDGLVREVADSPLMRSTPGPYAEDFRAAVEEAIRGWRFWRAETRTFKDGEDLDSDGTVDYKMMVSSEAIAVYLDVRFEFDIVDGKGRVRAGNPASRQEPRPDGEPR